MLQGEHSAILSTSIKQPFVFKIFVLFLFLSGRLRQGLLYILPGTFYFLSETSCCIDLVIAVDMSYSMTSEKCSCLREFLAALVERLVFTFLICHPLEDDSVCNMYGSTA